MDQLVITFAKVIQQVAHQLYTLIKVYLAVTLLLVVMLSLKAKHNQQHTQLLSMEQPIILITRHIVAEHQLL